MGGLSGRISSIQTMGTLDGPGVRFIVFTQGCPLRCGCCHNPETWDINGGSIMTAAELAERAEKYRCYFGKKGGITVSGGEPLLQADFVRELFSLCREKGINTCLDTSGCILNDSVERLLDVTDYCLLDIKYTTDEKYRSFVGSGMDAPLRFLERLEEKNIPTRLRQVTIKGLNDDEENAARLKELWKSHSCVEEVELLAFLTLCREKYEKLGCDFRFGDIPETPKSEVTRLQRIINE